MKYPDKTKIKSLRNNVKFVWPTIVDYLTQAVNEKRSVGTGNKKISVINKRSWTGKAFIVRHTSVSDSDKIEVSIEVTPQS